MLAVRRFTAEDAPAVTAIIRGLPDYFTDDVPAKAERDAASDEAWVISDSGAVAGFAIIAKITRRSGDPGGSASTRPWRVPRARNHTAPTSRSRPHR